MKKHVENKRHTNPSHPTHQLGLQSPLATIQSGRTVNRQQLTIAPARPLRIRPASESGGKYVWSFALPSCRSGCQRPYAALTPSRNAPRLAVARN
jgi:hypothetical protein